MNVKDIDVMVICSLPHYDSKESRWVMPQIHLLGNTVTVVCSGSAQCYKALGNRDGSWPIYGHGVVIPLQFAPLQESLSKYLQSNRAKRLLKKVWNGIGYVCIPGGVRDGVVIDDTPIVTTAMLEYDELMGAIQLLRRYRPVSVDSILREYTEDEWGGDDFTGNMLISILNDVLTGENLVFSCEDPVRAIVGKWANAQWQDYGQQLREVMRWGGSTWLTDHYQLVRDWSMSNSSQYISPLPASVLSLIKE